MDFVWVSTVSNPRENYLDTSKLFAKSSLLSFSSRTILTNTVARKFHRRLGYVASFFFVCHMLGALTTLYCDFVHHHAASKIILFQGLVQATIYFIGSLLAAKNHDIEVR
jgi:hypothetical protein